MTKNCTARAAAVVAAAIVTAPLLIAGCVDRPPDANSAAQITGADLSGFPTGTLNIVSGDARHEIQIWVAQTAEHRSRGLMFVRQLPKDRGMLFLFGDPQPVSMWMKNTLIPLDMLFVARDGRIARIAENTEPGSLATLESGSDVTAVLELAGGECARRGIRVGDFVRHPAFATT
jgi:uncharacterized membrane protein (UPF0127 family)